MENMAFCALLWNGADVSGPGRVRPCCSFSGIASEKLGDLEHVTTSDSFAAWKSAALQGKAVPGCQGCYTKEKNGGTSDRTLFNNYFGIHTDSDAIRYASAHDSDHSIERLSLHMGPLCNLRCMMCNPRASSRIAADPVHSKWAAGNDFSVAAERAASWRENLESLKGSVLQRPHALKAIQMSGGEPLIQPLVRETLAYLVEIGASKNIHLAMPTNGTKIDAEIIQLLSKFGSVGLRLSVDGIGEAGECIRYPSKFSEVSTLPSKVCHLSHIKVVVGYTLSALSLFEAGKVARWADVQKIGFQYGWVKSPLYLALGVLPSQVRHDAVAAGAVHMQSIQNERIRSELGSLLKMIDRTPSTDSEGSNNFFAFVREMDQNRRTKMSHSLPDLAQAIERAADFA